MGSPRMRRSGSTLRATTARIPWCPGDGSARAGSSPSSIRPAADRRQGLLDSHRPALPGPARQPRPGTRGARTYQTIEGLGSRLGIEIDSTFAKGEEGELAAGVVRDHAGVALICWEHHLIPAIAAALPVVKEAVIPKAWPGHRYDVVWSFTLIPDSDTIEYAFGQIPQLLLSGDSDSVIPVLEGLTPPGLSPVPCRVRGGLRAAGSAGIRRVSTAAAPGPFSASSAVASLRDRCRSTALDGELGIAPPERRHQLEVVRLAPAVLVRVGVELAPADPDVLLGRPPQGRQDAQVPVVAAGARSARWNSWCAS